MMGHREALKGGGRRDGALDARKAKEMGLFKTRGGVATIENGSKAPPPAFMRRGGYRFNELEVGQNILVPGSLDNVRRANSARSAASAFAKRHGVKFTTRMTNHGLRIWRVA